MSTDDPEIKELLGRALSHHEAGQIEEARDLYLEILDRDPRNSQALDLAGVLCMQCDELDAAADFFEAALEVDPDDARCLCHSGTLELKRGDLAKADALFRDSAERDPEYGEPHFYLGLSARAQNDPAAACDHLDAAIAADPNNVLFLTWRGILAKETDDLQAAGSYLEQALSLDEKNADAWFHLGDVMEAADDQTMAERCFRRASSILPDAGVVVARLGRNLAAQGRWEEARDEFRRGISVEESLSDNWSGLALVLHDLGEDAESKEAAEKALSLDQDDVYAHLAVSRIAKRAGDTAAADAAIARVRELAAGDPAILAELY